jgi:O-antigen ligase
MFIIICAVSLLTVSFSIKYGGISILDRLTEVAEQKLYYETSASRLEVYRLAWSSIIKNPLVGVGTGPFAGITETGDAVHNVILLNWYESGIFGLIGIMLILILLLLIGVYLIRISKSENERLLSLSLFASYVAFLVIGMAQPIYYKRFGWISSALIMALYVLRRQTIISYSSQSISTRNN